MLTCSRAPDRLVEPIGLAIGGLGLGFTSRGKKARLSLHGPEISVPEIAKAGVECAFCGKLILYPASHYADLRKLFHE